jgi:phosphoribosylaminoimidazole-succinocarboxamide synthase
MTLPALILEGSVKNIRGTKGVSPYVFEYSDRYSVFDWGAMPNQLDGKGKSLAFMAWMFFDLMGDANRWKEWKLSPELEKKYEGVLADLRQHGMKHHCNNLVDDSNNPIEGLGLSKNLSVQAVDVFRPNSSVENGKLIWDYSKYQDKLTNCLVPLEIVFRFGLPAGSSLFQRASDAAYLSDLGLSTLPKEGERFDSPVIEFSTKLETTDRYIASSVAQKMAGLNDREFKKLKDQVVVCALRLKDLFAEVGIELWDGKFEMGVTKDLDHQGDRNFMMVDSIGPDELRLTYKGQQLSKENLRHCYRGSDWYKGVETAKQMATERGEKDWKKICREELKLTPPALDTEVVNKFSMMYKSLANTLAEKYYQRSVFPDAWTMDELYLKLK